MLILKKIKIQLFTEINLSETILTMVSTLNNSHIILYIINLSIININNANKTMTPCSGKWDNTESETP